MIEIPAEYIKNLYKALLVLLIVLSVSIIGKSFSPGFKSDGIIGDKETNTITVSGYGEVSAAPDIANVYFTIRKEGTTVKEAQDAVAVVEKASLDFLKSNNVAEKDIKTSNASFNPQYKYVYEIQALMPCNEWGCPPRPGKNVISGYEAYESITVKIRNTDDVGKIMQGLGGLGVTDLNGPNFAIDDEEGLQAEARKIAIDNAKEKAKVLARDLDVKLGKISNFSEGGNYPMPLYYGKAEMMSADSGASVPAEIPKGENTIISNVTITYEIR
ncbi:MAG: SIMPL domain-containing protein [Patescibacteria group bacterium]